jgi:carboxyl-terminal processing protease
MIKRYKTLFGVVIIFISFSSFSSFSLLGDKKNTQPQSESEKEYRYLSLFSEVVTLVKTRYVEAVNTKDKFPGAFSAMLCSLDPYSSYLDAEKTEIYRSFQKGQFYGCGIYGAKYGNYFYITDVAAGSSAEKEGLKNGDIIKAVNGKSIYAHSFWEMYLSLLSTKPQNIEAVLLKTKERDAKKITLQMELIEPRTTIKTLQKNILLVKLSRFDSAAALLLKDRLTTQNKPLKLIIDLRRYTGGEFESFKKIINLFFKGPILLTLKLKDKEEDFLLGSREALEYKAVVIINRSTRMYGELLAALFKQAGAVAQRPTSLVGTSTQGFISKLKAIHLEDGSSILLTEGLFLLNGKSTASKGVVPDIVIKGKASGEIIEKSISILNSRTPSRSVVKKNDKKKTKIQ